MIFTANEGRELICVLKCSPFFCSYSKFLSKFSFCASKRSFVLVHSSTHALKRFLDVIEGNLFIVYVFDCDHAAKEGKKYPPYE